MYADRKQNDFVTQLDSEAENTPTRRQFWSSAARFYNEANRETQYSKF